MTPDPFLQLEFTNITAYDFDMDGQAEQRSGFKEAGGGYLEIGHKDRWNRVIRKHDISAILVDGSFLQVIDSRIRKIENKTAYHRL